MNKKLLYLFTRTPLHVGAGASVGAIDQPIIRERHTGFPIIPATSLKGTLADQWPLTLRNAKGELVRLTTKKNGDKTAIDKIDPSDAAWLFGSDDANVSFAGALQFTEARLLAFPVRSAKGSFAWITCPLILRRAARDGVLTLNPSDLPDPSDDNAFFPQTSPLALDGKVVLEEYTFTRAGDLPPNLATALAGLLTDPVWAEVANRLVILSDGMMSFFTQNACEVAQHVRIDDDTGTAAGGALFNQENVPSETLFYAVLHATDERTAGKAKEQRRNAEAALKTFGEKLASQVFQFGGDASTGLGWCTVKLADPANSTAQKGA
jgi:CRISPR-associated protein Cmr4